MPYIITQPQKIEGTRLGYAIYPYQFSFEDHMTGKGDRKLVVMELAVAPVIDPICILTEEVYNHRDTRRGDIEMKLMQYVNSHPEFVLDKNECKAYFERIEEECFHREIDRPKTKKQP